MTYKVSNIRIFLVTGPGHHAPQLISALHTILNEDFYYTTYWPQFAHYIKRADGTDVLVQKGGWQYFVHKLVWSIAARIPWLKHKNKHLDWSYTLYDLYVKSRYDKEPILWAWAQMSLYTMQKALEHKANVILEYPMIHCDEWSEILKAYVGAKAYSKSYSCFSNYMSRVMQKEIQLTCKINVLSSYAKATFISQGVSETKINISHLYIDHKKFDRHPGTSQANSEKLRLLFVGRAEILKGIPNLVKALKQIDFDYELHMVGTIYPEVNDLLSEIEPNLRFHGQLNAEALTNMYHHCHVLVLPSVQESFGLVILEALSCGLPVLASKNTGAPDIIQHKINGYIFDPFDTDEIVDGLIFFNNNIVKDLESFNASLSTVWAKYSDTQYRSDIKHILD